MVIDKIKKINKEEKIEKNTKAADMLIGKWVKCDECKEILYKDDVHKNFSVCPNCGKHFRISARRRIKQIIDEEVRELNHENNRFLLSDTNEESDRKSTRLNSSHTALSRMPSSA